MLTPTKLHLRLPDRQTPCLMQRLFGIEKCACLHQLLHSLTPLWPMLPAAPQGQDVDPCGPMSHFHTGQAVQHLSFVDDKEDVWKVSRTACHSQNRGIVVYLSAMSPVKPYAITRTLCRQ